MSRKIWILGVLILSLSACAPTQKQSSQGAEPLAAAQAQDLIQQKKALVLLDVRTPDEYQQGHLQGAQNLDFYQDFGNKITGLDKNQEYLVYCAVGGRSAQAVEQMRAQGFKVYDLKGGYKAWQAAGMPTTK